MWPILYRGFISPALALVYRLAALRSPKAAAALEGRRRWRQDLAALQARTGGVPRLHVHAASVGEFEQAKPIVEEVRRRLGVVIITASFFSSSGYNQQRAWGGVDAACYLPAERRAEMAAFLDRIDPDCVLIMRYDLWPAFLMGLADRGVPAVLACGVLRADSGRFNPLLRGFFAWMYGMLAHAFVVEPGDAEAFRRLVPRLATEVCGDTRYDRVAERVATQADLGPLSRGSLLGPEPGTAAPLIVVAGSTWPADERVLRPLAEDPRFRLIIVPHEPTADHVAALLAEFPGSIAASALPAAGPAGPPDSSRATVVVDRTGLLALLYRVADIVYVGGAFGEGVHSVLEPAAYGLPVIAGPGLARSRDAVALHRSGALAVVRTGPELHAEAGRLYDDPAERARRADVARAFVAGRVGATERIVAALHGRLAAPRAQGAGQGA